MAHARTINSAFCIVVADTAGDPIVSARMDGAPRICAGIAASKANTVAGFGGLATAELWQAIEGEPDLVHGLTQTPGFAAFGGGVGIFVNDDFVGAIGVSGGTTDQDAAAAAAGAAALSEN